jgi:hypothetical protein
MTRYLLLEAHTVQTIETLINKALSRGWSLHGTLVVTTRTSEDRSISATFLQAMVRDEPTEPAPTGS